MNCPHCDSTQIIVKNTRPTKGNTQIWRRRQCLDCKYTFTTYERIDLSNLIVIKKSGETERFKRNKLYSGIYGATIGSKIPNREIKVSEITRLAEKEILALKKKKITSQEIADIVLKILKEKQMSTFLRFLAYHKKISSSKQVKKEIKKYLKD